MKWAGQLSPFSRTENHAKVSDADFSYITSDQVKRGDYMGASNDDRDTDILVIKDKSTNHSIHFPAQSIDRDELSVGQLRQQTAKKLGRSASKSVKLFYKGKALADDTKSCRSEGLRHASEILCSLSAEQDSTDASSASEDDSATPASHEKTAKKKRRGKSKKKKTKKPDEQGTLDVPPPVPSRAATPKPRPTPAGMLDAAGQELEQLIVMCNDFKTNPPTDATKKQFEHKRLGEVILTRVVLKLDAVETDDPDLRVRRKELVRRAQAELKSLDDSMK